MSEGQSATEEVPPHRVPSTDHWVEKRSVKHERRRSDTSVHSRDNGRLVHLRQCSRRVHKEHLTMVAKSFKEQDALCPRD